MPIGRSSCEGSTRFSLLRRSCAWLSIPGSGEYSSFKISSQAWPIPRYPNCCCNGNRIGGQSSVWWYLFFPSSISTSTMLPCLVSSFHVTLPEIGSVVGAMTREIPASAGLPIAFPIRWKSLQVASWARSCVISDADRNSCVDLPVLFSFSFHFCRCANDVLFRFLLSSSAARASARSSSHVSLARSFRRR